MTTQYARPWLQPLQHAQNGSYPDALFQHELASLANHCASFRLKQIASFGMTTGVISSPAAATPRARWRCRYVPSPHASAIIVQGWLALSELENTSQSPYALVEVVDPVLGTTGTGELHYGAASTESSVPDACGAPWTPLRAADGSLFAPDPGAEYEVTISDVQSRLVACTIYEVRMGFTGPHDENFAATGPIRATDRSDLVESARAMWTRGAAPLFAWSVDDQSSPRTSTSGTTKNLIDDASTTVSAATVGYTLDLRNRARLSTGTVTCALAVYGSSTDESTVYLRDSSGATVASIAVSGAAAWHVDTCELPATLAKYDIHYDGPFGETTSIYAVQLIQVED